MLQPQLVSLHGPGDLDILLIAGVHGNELTPMKVLPDLYHKSEKEADYYKRLTFLIGANPYALEERKREGKYEEKDDLNRSFHTSYDSKKELKELIDLHQIVIDVHSSPRCCNLVLFDNDQFAPSLYQWCKKTGLTYACRNFNGDTIKKYVLSKGKIGLTVELCGTKMPTFGNIDTGAAFLRKLLRDLHLIKILIPNNDGSPKTWVDILSPAEGIISYFDGILGKRSVKGEAIGVINDFQGRPRNSIVMPCTGTVVDLPDTDYIKMGEIVASIQPD